MHLLPWIDRREPTSVTRRQYQSRLSDLTRAESRRGLRYAPRAIRNINNGLFDIFNAAVDGELLKLEGWTHPGARDIFRSYSRFSFEENAEAMSRIDLRRRTKIGNRPCAKFSAQRRIAA
jgi:hypothetical protein